MRAARHSRGYRERNSTNFDRSPPPCPIHPLFLDSAAACTRLLERGVPYPVVATIMGWSASTAIRMAKRYGHIGQKAMRDAMEVLERTESELEYPKNPPKSTSADTEVLN